MATNFKHKGKVLTVPTVSGAESGDAFVVGSYMPGVLISDAETASPYEAPVRVEGVFELSCKANNGSGDVAISVGDALYWTDKDTPLDKDSSEDFFGIALEAVDSGETETINVYITPKMAAAFVHENDLILTAKVALTSANIKAMNATPVQIIAAPGADAAIEFLSAVIHYEHDGSYDYTNGGDVTFKIADGATVSNAISAANSFGASGDKLTQCVGLDTANGIALTANKALQITNADAAFAGDGTGTATVHVSYRILDLS